MLDSKWESRLLDIEYRSNYIGIIITSHLKQNSAGLLGMFHFIHLTSLKRQNKHIIQTMYVLLKYLCFSILMNERAGSHGDSETVIPKLLCATVPSQMTSTAHSAPHD